MQRSTRTLITVSMVCVLASLFFATNGIAQAHGDVVVGEYELTIGFRNEPAYAGEPNGLDLRVVKVAGEESEGEAESTQHEAGEPVVGLEDTLNAEIIYGSHIRELELRPIFGEPGAYTADVLPVEAGDYTWHIWGEIEGTPVDEELTSGPDTFSAVESKGGIAFPAAEPGASELAAQARLALIVGIAGAVLGVVGIVIGLTARAKR